MATSTSLGGPDDDDVEMIEVSYGRYWLDGWASGDGDSPDFGELFVSPGELLPAGALDDVAPDEQWVNEASGNEGVSVERAYRHAALVVWPRRRALDVLARESIERAVDWVGQHVERDAVEARDLIARLISIWPTERPTQKGEGRADMLRVLEGIGDAKLAMRFLREVLLLRYDGSENDTLPVVLRRAEPKDTAEFLVELVESHFPFQPDATLALLLRLGESGDFDWRDMLGRSVRAALAALPLALSPRDEKPEVTWPPAPTRKPIGEAELRDLFILAWRCGLADEAETAAAAVMATHPSAISPQRPSRRRWKRYPGRRVSPTARPAHCCGAMPPTRCWTAARSRPRHRRTGWSMLASPAIANSARRSRPSARILSTVSGGFRCARTCASICIGRSMRIGSTCPMSPSGAGDPIPSFAQRTERAISDGSRNTPGMSKRCVR